MNGKNLYFIYIFIYLLLLHANKKVQNIVLLLTIQRFRLYYEYIVGTATILDTG